MKIEISSKNIELLPSLTEYVNEKMGTLEKHLQKLEMEGELRLIVKLGRVTAHHQKGDVFEASADLELPKVNLRADQVNEDLHTSIDMIRDILAQEIEQYKEKHGEKHS